MAKRGSSGLSLVVAIDKPTGMTSHDVVNRCRKVFEERRVGHTGTLDPLATGVLPICVGPATRLDRYLVGHDKRYRVTIRFGFETDTDDSEGNPTVHGKILPDLADGAFAFSYISGLVGVREQIPPQYSAIKTNGKKAYEQVRQGATVELKPRRIEVYESQLVERRFTNGTLDWVVDFSVSKGTYIRALVRDIGRELGCPAHVDALERRQVGLLSIEECISLETLERLGVKAAVDPVSLLGFPLCFADRQAQSVASGGRLGIDEVEMFQAAENTEILAQCACTNSPSRLGRELETDELVSVVVSNRLQAVYRYDVATRTLRPDCVFAVPVVRSAP